MAANSSNPLSQISAQTILNNICPYDRRNWFSVLCFQNITNFQLDIVGFLAILGEGSVLASSQVATLSKITFLPRLLPAPQALMRPSRPSVLQSVNGYATAVHSGNHRSYVNHVGHVLIDAETLPEYSVRCVEIKRKHNAGEVKAKTLGPLWLVAILGCTMSCTLLGLSIWQSDGFAFIAILALSLLSTLVGIGNKWTLNLPKRKNNTITPPGDVVIRYPKGSFLVVTCHEDVARELYFAPENIDYLVTQSWRYRIISLVGTSMLMAGVITLSNASTYLQIGVAASYMILNASYWVVAALPSKVHWDMSCFEVLDQCFENDERLKSYSQSQGRHRPFVDLNDTFTQALWKVIIATKEIGWIKRSVAAPDTEAWDVWLQEAKEQARSAGSHYVKCNGTQIKVWEVPEWNPGKALAQALKDHQDPTKV